MLRRAFPPLLLLALIPTTAQSTRPGSALDWSVAVEGASPEVAVTARWEHAIGSTQLALFVDGQRVQRVSTSLAAGELRFAPAALPPGTVDVELVWSAGRTELGRERLAIDADYAAMLGRLRESSMEPMERMDLDGVMVALVGAFPTSGSTDYERAMAFLEGHGGLFGLVDPRDELVPAERIDGPPVRTLRFTWQHDGIPAPGAGLSVHLAGDRVVGTSGRYPTGWRHTDEARLTENEAVSLALAQSPGSARVGRPRLIWVDGRLHHHEDGEAFLAWEVQIDGAGRGARTVRLDAVTGDVLYDRSAESHAPLNFEIDDADAFIDDSSICFYPITPACSDEDPSCPAGSVTEAFDWMNDAHAYFETRHGFHAWDDEQVELIVDADLSSPAAYKKWPCDQIKFGPGKLEAPGVFFHEWTHGIDQATKALDTNPKTGAVKEHLANMFGMHRVRQDVPDTFDMFAGITSEEGISELGSGVPVDLSGWDDEAEDPHANRNVLDLAARRSWIGANTTGLPIPPMGDEAISRLYWEAFEHQFQPYMLHIDLPYYLLSMALILQQ
ncbi:MAG: hypothetical protein H6734_28095, partial [Alphaproteobacteria bacterium]|nr:hypothetical protein [Alphaproteobacteria bacterium]